MLAQFIATGVGEPTRHDQAVERRIGLFAIRALGKFFEPRDVVTPQSLGHLGHLVGVVGDVSDVQLRDGEFAPSAKASNGVRLRVLAEGPVDLPAEARSPRATAPLKYW
jgi:hypothetical protein